MYNITLSSVPHFIIGLFCTFADHILRNRVSHLKWESCVSQARFDCHIKNTEQGEVLQFCSEGFLNLSHNKENTQNIIKHS